MADADTGVWVLVGPWQYQCAVQWGTGRVLGGYYTLPPTQPAPYPGYYPPTAPPSLRTQPCVTAVLSSTKEILGVEYAQYRSGHAQACAATGVTLRPELSGPSLRACSTEFYHILSISQYFSVYLRLNLRYISGISQVEPQVYLRLNLRYISVFLSISQYLR